MGSSRWARSTCGSISVVYRVSLIHIIIVIACAVAVVSILHGDWALFTNCKAPLEVTPIFGRIYLCKVNDWSALVGKNLARNSGKWQFEVRRVGTSRSELQPDDLAVISVVLCSEREDALLLPLQ